MSSGEPVPELGDRQEIQLVGSGQGMERIKATKWQRSTETWKIGSQKSLCRSFCRTQKDKMLTKDVDFLQLCLCHLQCSSEYTPVFFCSPAAMSLEDITYLELLHLRAKHKLLPRQYLNLFGSHVAHYILYISATLCPYQCWHTGKVCWCCWRWLEQSHSHTEH